MELFYEGAPISSAPVCRPHPGPGVEAALAEKSVRWPGSLDVPHTFSYLPEMARALVTLGERADGRIWHLPAAPPITGRKLLDLVSSRRAGG